RAAATTWRLMASTSTTAGKVLLELLHVMEDLPLDSMGTVDGDSRAIFPLAATRALREILRLPICPQALVEHCPRFFVALLSQIFCSTEQMPEEVDPFWR
ncbi:hypothetical protein N320_12173, partial [Buceros rhinoceros silvestris]